MGKQLECSICSTESKNSSLNALLKQGWVDGEFGWVCPACAGSSPTEEEEHGGVGAVGVVDFIKKLGEKE